MLNDLYHEAMLNDCGEHAEPMSDSEALALLMDDDEMTDDEAEMLLQ